MATLTGGPRVLLRQLRETMAEPLGSQDRLNKIVDLIADNMRADVCSFYVLRDDGALELFATHGLKAEAVHMTTLRLGEGLVGLIAAEAEPLSLDNAPAHPSFAYRPETGEDPFYAFLGVPVLRAGQTLGVLVVQNKDRRVFGEDEVEAMLTTATILAEMIATSEFDSLIKPGSDIDLRRPRTFDGLALAEGIALGQVVLHDPRVVVNNFIADDIDAEKQRLDLALEKMRVSIDVMLDHGDMQPSSDHREILETYRMFANDRGWVGRLMEAIDNGLSAEAAVERVQNDTRARMLRQTDPYIRDRLHDLDDLANRLLRVLTGNADGLGKELPDNAILVARNMGPAELLEYDRTKLRGIVLEEGGSTSHVAIVARSLGVVAVGQAESIVSMSEEGDDIIVDGATGTVHLRPTPDVEQTYVEKVKLSAKRRAHYLALRDLPSVTRDGVKITLLHNSGLVADLPMLNETGAEGVGLFRTELQFMIASKLPRLNEQVELYRDALRIAGDRPVVFRLLDIGGDKVVPYMRSAAEENPAMGWRSLRLALDRPGLLRTQVRALLMAAEGKPMKILVPMVTEAFEFRQARMVVQKEIDRLKRAGETVPTKVELGAMIEVPSLLFELDQLLPEADFVSIGSNDLIQFLTAADRANPRVSKNYDPIALPRLRALRHIVDAARRYNVPLTMCGELAGKPLEALALMAIGMNRLSMGPSSIGPVKEMILGLELEPIRKSVAAALADGSDGVAMRDLLKEWVDRQNLPV
ncbi:phosphoenolpyruvate--protein phosphotransferase [Paradevosia shaoguanensis]|jgi:phosphotransferase system enzyme I (PtsP)|uniref:phosphoenolpyruvate--protein phosphotransferase n=1 Tax=Paradevosia shaoguanensis TaxID=1335043 RepID=A0AA41QR92_9HYPH|nr:phosphoenolpyruvate--protein phosphotransferase [Paradevosia shaoguanensis]KFL24884.1 peptidase [Devosia sp. 17-2-E-8]MCF1745064.1 phosphoenolpyruvate--protein phosphotransferase [Paradevosia shaoguanensis]MCI0129547.1 phosphoenolpyruvate--protein phosphotransferase [Paradevosia shaoguanensis]QMV00617.1 phosphoenolpyruvate--protein phosphotransferase [Devosia sp. D6-9]